MFEKYHILSKEEDFIKVDHYLIDSKTGKFNFNYVAIDTETNGLAFWKDLVIGISFSVDDKAGFYIPILEWKPFVETTKEVKYGEEKIIIYPEGNFQCYWTGEKVSENATQEDYAYPPFIAAFLNRWFRETACNIIMHNAPFDVLMIKRALGVDLADNLFCDTVLLKHVLDENSSRALKETAIQWQQELGIPAEEEANKEQIELGRSIVENGGTYNKSNKHIWRADPDLLAKYAIADTFLTYGIFQVGMKKLEEEFSAEHFEWFFVDEVMPVCKEVVIPLRERGVQINEEYFKLLSEQVNTKLALLEDEVISILEAQELLQGFSVGKSLEEAVSKKRLIEKIIELEGLDYPVMVSKGQKKKSLSKAVVKKAYEAEPHWLWGYMLGEDDLRYSEKKLLKLKQQLYTEVEGRRYRFNIKSAHHLRWLFCEKLGHSATDLPQTESGSKDKPVPSMKAEVLKEHFGELYSFIKPLLLFKKLEKISNTYIEPALNLNYKGKLYMDLRQDGTKSGRFACKGGFNLQTLPAIEELDICYKCKSENIEITKDIEILANMKCNDCGYTEEDIFAPSVIKGAFTAPEGMVIVNADYSSLEPRCFSFVSNDDKLKAIYKENLDMYSKIYCDMMGEGYRNLKKTGENDKRSKFKPVALGIPYGARGPQVANLMNLKTTRQFPDKETGEWKKVEVLDVEEGIRLRKLYLDTYKDLHKYMTTAEMDAMVKGHTETMIGRRRHFKFATKVFELLKKADIDYEQFLDSKKSEWTRQEIDHVFNKESFKKLADECGFGVFDPKKKMYRDWSFVRAMFKNELNNAKNFPIQGLAAHITNKAMLEMTRKFKAAGVQSWVFLQVHDEISVYSKKEEAELTAKLLQEAMEINKYTGLLDIPMIAEPLIANTLKEAK